MLNKVQHDDWKKPTDLRMAPWPDDSSIFAENKLNSGKIEKRPAAEGSKGWKNAENPRMGYAAGGTNFAGIPGGAQPPVGF